MKHRVLTAAALATAATLAVAPTVSADDHELNLYETLETFGPGFDTDQNDFDIVREAIEATGLDGAAATLELTAFLPTDKAFRILVEDLYGLSIKDEQTLFDTIVEVLGVETVRDVLLYHLTAGPVFSTDVLALGDGATFPTLLGPELEIDMKGKGQIRLIDEAGSLRDPILRAFDIEASNGVAHVMDRVLVPLDV